MGALIGGLCFASLFLIAALVTHRASSHRVTEIDDDEARNLRQFFDRPWAHAFLLVSAVLSLVGGAFLVVRGHAVGWGWLVVAVLYVAAFVVARRSRSRLLAQLGDRGAIHRSSRSLASAATSYRFGAVGLTGYLGTKVVEYAYPDTVPTGAQAVIVGFSLLMVVGAIGFLVVRTRMYLRGDDLESAPNDGQ